MRTILRQFQRGTILGAGLLLALLGGMVFGTGLANPFMGDDIPQIVESVPVHSLENVPNLFRGGTFYNGRDEDPLSGIYYRPLVTTTYALIYSLFGPAPIAFHVVQLALHILCAVLIFAILRYFIRPVIALLLAAVFLVHPINSQAVYMIAALQEPLFVVFGLLGFWIVVYSQYKSRWHLVLAAACLLLSLFAKETGLLFLMITALYVLMTDRKRLYYLLSLYAVCIVVYLMLRIPAIGLFNAAQSVPINDLSLAQRIMNIPSIISFYVAKLVFPWELAHGYYWAHKTFTVQGVLMPLILDIFIVTLLVILGHKIARNHHARYSMLYRFFGAWLGLGLALHLHIIPLDMTAFEAWFYFAMIGFLGMVGILWDAFVPRAPLKATLVVAAVIIAVLSVRSTVRGFDWRDEYQLAIKDLKISKEDYNSENVIAHHFIGQRRYAEAKLHAERSITLHPAFNNYELLGLSQVGLGDYARAKQAFLDGLKYQDYYTLHESLSALVATSSPPDTPDDRAYIEQALARYPRNNKLWLYLAIYEHRRGRNAEAVDAIRRARAYGNTNDFVYEKILNNEPFTVSLDPATQ